VHFLYRFLAHPLWPAPGGGSGTSPTGPVAWLGRFPRVRRPLLSNFPVLPGR